MAAATSAEIALRSFVSKVRAKFPDAAPDFDEDKIQASVKVAANMKEANYPGDSRFPNISQSGLCWTKFNEHIVCLKRSGGNEAECNPFRRHYNEVCPAEWVETFESHIDEGVFMGIRPE